MSSAIGSTDDRKPSRTEERAVPLCVDLDGTLLKTDTLVEGLMRLLKRSVWSLLGILPAMFVSRARFKKEVAIRTELNVGLLPANQSFVDWLREQQSAGRPLVLCTAANFRIAEKVAEHYGLFCRVIASDDNHNLSGRTKGARLLAEFGRGGYDYAGNEVKDLHVWETARHAVVVNPSAALTSRLASLPRTEKVFPRETVNRARSWVRAMRLHQWAKNVLVFVPAVASHRLLDLDILLSSVIAFLAFGLCASGTYLLNDLLDLDDDRQHPRKRLRPFASGELALITGIFVAAGMVITAVLVAILSLGWLFTGVLAAYIVATVWYSAKLKRIPMVDILTLATLYTVRVIAGAAATHIRPSFWLLAFSVFLFLSLAAAKRYAELLLMAAASKTKAAGRGYLVDDLPLVQSCGVASGYLSVLVLALYINSGAAGLYSRPEAMWLLCPVLMYWMNRVWLKTHRGLMHDDPLVFTLRDKASLIAGAFAVVLVLVAL